jgi:flavin reductase (DIM6/NTAB) family NADH-FMN oxidoreductase RutF
MHLPKRPLTPDTTLYPVPVVLITCGAGDQANLFSLNRIASCNAEPPMISISVRPLRASHDLIDQLGEFVVNIPWPDMEPVSDFVGTTTSRNTDKWRETGLTPLPASIVKPPLLAQCPVSLECQVRHTLRLLSHSLFVAEVVALHADESVLNERQEVDFTLAEGGLAYRAGVVRERPVERFRPAELRQKVRDWRSRG